MPHPTTPIVLGACGVALTAVIGAIVTHAAAWTELETSALSAIAADRGPVGLAVAEFIAWLFSPTVAVAITLLLAVVIGLATRYLTRAVVFTVIVAMCWGASETMKLVVQRPRPSFDAVAVAVPTSYSYPSGHTAFACAIVIALLFTMRDIRRRMPVTLAGAALVALVAWSRMYLGVHFPTDVVASVLLTCSMAGIVIPLIVNVALPQLRSARRPEAEGATDDGGD
ncbi:phosphatase PAP2 family protein [Rathayibacter sp. CAU 1779]